MVLASLGVACGALFSSCLMEVARKGIFNPDQFYFDEIMLIFVAVMLTDILLLDFFNTIGLPTSTTVSIVFELLGAAARYPKSIQRADISYPDTLRRGREAWKTGGANNRLAEYVLSLIHI